MIRPLDSLIRAGIQSAALPAPPDPPYSFTVIIRTQGRRPHSLAEALDAVAAQTHEDHRVVLVVHADQATHDRVRAELGARVDEPRVQLLRTEGGGRSRPLNAALAVATGDYVCFLDDDDLVTADWLAAFARGATTSPGAVIRAVTQSQRWTTDGGTEPVHAIGPVERPFPEQFDLLAHMSRNDTPICSIAVPLGALVAFDIEFCEELAVFEDWDLLMRVAMLTGVTSIPEATSLYRRLDHGDADTAESEAVWHASHAQVIQRLSQRPVLLPIGDAQRVASAHFRPGAGSRWESDLETAQAELDRVTRSPLRWARVFAGRVASAIRSRIAKRRP